MSDLVYRKTETERTDSPLDKKSARIDALIRIVVLLSIAAILIGVTIVTVSSLNTSKQNKSILEAVIANQNQIATQTEATKIEQKQLLELTKDIKDCNTPEGKCYARRIAELSAQSGQVNAITLAAAYCTVAVNIETYADMTSCVLKLTGDKG